MNMTAQSKLGDYVQNSVHAEDPLEMVCLLYAKAIERINAAREHLSRNEIPERAQAIALASQIVLELQTSLDAERGGEIAVNLDRVYAFVQEQLVEANAKQAAEPLEVSLRLLETLYDGWQECRAQHPEIPARPEPARDGRKNSPAAPQPEEDIYDPLPTAATQIRAWTL